MATVGWLGLGAMGLPLASRAVAAGHEVIAYDPHADRLAFLTERGARAASDVAKAARGVDLLVVIVATPDQAEDALFGRGAAAQLLAAGCNVVVLSTVGPNWIRGASRRLPAGVGLVDAPVSGGVDRAARGELLIMASGQLTEGSRRLLAEFGEVVQVGTVAGAGQAVKMVNQLLCGVHIAAAAEALAFAEALGLDPRMAWETVRRGAAASFMLDDRGRRMVEGHQGTPRSAVSIFVKDLRLVLDNARGEGLPTPLVATAEQLFAIAAASGLAGHDDSQLIEVFRGWLHRLSTG